MSPVLACQYLAKAAFEVDVELARRIVGDIEQFNGFLTVRGHGQKTKSSEQDRERSGRWRKIFMVSGEVFYRVGWLAL